MKRLTLVLLCMASAALGGFAVWLLGKYRAEQAVPASALRLEEKDSFDQIAREQEKMFRSFDSLFGDNLFHQDDPFAEMRKMRERMEKHFSAGKKGDSPFDAWFGDRFGGGSVEDIRQREDESFVYYEISLPEGSGAKVNAMVQGESVIISGEVGQVSKGSGMQSSFRSTYRRMFPVPERTNASKMEMISEPKKLILKFPKESERREER